MVRTEARVFGGRNAGVRARSSCRSTRNVRRKKWMRSVVTPAASPGCRCAPYRRARGWVVWAVPTAALTFPASRALGHGLDVRGAGIVPLHAVRRDGWRVQISGLPTLEDMPTWLVAELDGRWANVKASAK
jgi:hypothetical protein